MPVADILRLGLGAMTSQHIADMALQEDQSARLAAKRGDYEAAASHDAESVALCRLLNGPATGG